MNSTMLIVNNWTWCDLILLNKNAALNVLVFISKLLFLVELSWFLMWLICICSLNATHEYLDGTGNNVYACLANLINSVGFVLSFVALRIYFCHTEIILLALPFTEFSHMTCTECYKSWVLQREIILATLLFRGSAVSILALLCLTKPRNWNAYNFTVSVIHGVKLHHFHEIH